MFNVLILGSDTTLLHALVEIIGRGGFINIHTAPDTAVAQDILGEHHIPLLVTPIRFPEVDNIQLVSQLARTQPDLKIILLTSNAGQVVVDGIRQLISLIHLDHDRDLSMLTRRIYTELGIEYGGQINGVQPASLVQMMSLEGRDCTLEVRAKKGVGYLWLRNGELVAARYDAQKGEEAALQILSMKNVRIDIDYATREIEHEISTPVMMLILESGRIDDEHRNSISDRRKDSRVERRMALELNWGDITGHCFLRDLSMGGAYIESDLNIPLGETLYLTFRTPLLQSTCKITTILTRKDSGGIGLQFVHINAVQQQIIESLMGGKGSAAPATEKCIAPAEVA